MFTSIAQGASKSDLTQPTELCRVLHINAGNLYGGVETILATLGLERDLCSSMESHFALCYSGRLSQELLQAGLDVHMLGPVRISRPWTVWRARRCLRELLRRERFDLVICHMPWSFAIFGPTVKRAGQRLGFWGHNFYTGQGWLERLAQLAKPDLAIATSRCTEIGLEDLFPGSSHCVIHPPVSLPPSSGVSQNRAALRKSLGADPDTVAIVQVGRLERYKGHLLHLQALSHLRDLDNWVCWIVGGPQKSGEESYLAELHQAAAEAGLTGRIQWLGQRADVGSLLNAADIFCQPNMEPEPFGIVFVEALGAGLPVVATALGGALEIVDDSCGALSKPGDAAHLAELLRALIQSPELRVHLGSAGVERARELCDPATQLNKLKHVALASRRA